MHTSHEKEIIEDATDIFYATDVVVEDGIYGNSVASVIDTSLLDFDEMSETKKSQEESVDLLNR